MPVEEEQHEQRRQHRHQQLRQHHDAKNRARERAMPKSRGQACYWGKREIERDTERKLRERKKKRERDKRTSERMRGGRRLPWKSEGETWDWLRSEPTSTR